MSNQWTDGQKDAINSRGGALLVSAAAGAGKTMVLVERIISLITDQDRPVDVDRLLVVTFTNAAAAEMRERIGRALAREMALRPGSGRLRRQTALLGRACISTLHSFCLEILRQHYYRLDLDPAFRVADETEAALLQTGAMEDLFERRYAAADNPAFTALVDCYGGKRDDSALQEMVLQAYLFARSTPGPGEWLARLPEQFDLPDDVSFDHLSWSGILKRALGVETSVSLAGIDLALRLAGRPGGPAGYLSNLAEDRATVLSLFQSCSAGVPWQDLYNSFNQAAFGRLKPCRKVETDEALVAQVKKLRDSAKKKIAGLQQEFFSRLPEELCADLRVASPLVREFAGLVVEFGEVYSRAKAARGVVDFSDLEHYCLQILSGEEPQNQAPVQQVGEHGLADSCDPTRSLPPGQVVSPVARELRERFAEVLVDEYQDINAVQEAILKLVSRQGDGEPNLFMVGDVKQSIYRFRLAEPGLFLEKYKNYPIEKGGPERCLDLVKNFRSRRGVVNAVNFIFRQLMTPAVGEMAYDEKAELVYGADFPPAPEGQMEPGDEVELYLIERDEPEVELGTEPGQEQDAGPAGDLSQGMEKSGQEETEEDLDTQQKEARLVAARIKELVAGSSGMPGLAIYDKELKSYRPLAYRDVVVLMRATSGYANTFVEEFRQAGVPAYAELATGYFEATEVETVLSLLRVIDNPRQDIALAAVLRSPIFGLKAGDLAQIRLARRRGDFFDAVVEEAKSGQGELAGRLRDFLDRLERWRTAARQGPLADLIWSIYRQTGYYDFVGGLPGGGQRQANLRALHYRARQYEETAFRGLFLFLRFIERVREGSRDLGAARALSEKEDVVRIMSIHKSKGLEFPVVFVAGLGRRFNFKSLQGDMLFHKDLGLGLQLVNPVVRVTYPTVSKLALKRQLRTESLAEEMRILYVALTRAREKLILVGSAKNLEACAGRWCSQVGVSGWTLPDGMLAGALSYLDWLVPALARHVDGAQIRSLGLSEDDPPQDVASDGSRWKINFAGGSGQTREEKEAATELLSKVRRMEPLEEPGPLAGVIKTRLEWSYPAAAVVAKVAKAPVTELKRKFDQLAAEEGDSPAGPRPAINKRPLFLQEERGLTAAEAGSALHLVLQTLDLKGDLEKAAIERHVAGMVERELLTHEQAETVPAGKVATFFKGTLGCRVLAGREVLRELPFTLAMPAEEIYPDLAQYPGEVVLVQGVVDCLVDEGDGYLLLDYKTDRIPSDQLEQAVARYRGQLNLYTRAVEEITGQKVKEKYLYLFHPGREVRCP